MKKKKERILIIDGNAVIHRSYHALPPTITTKSGQMVNAVYGFTSVLIKAINEFKPEYVVLTLDKKGPTFRHEMYKEYKATRKKQPDDLYNQFPLVKKVAKAFNIPIIEKSGYEADDLIGTITKLTGEGIEDIIVTGDMDALQLVNDSTKVYTMSRGLSDSVIYDTQAVINRYKFGPDLIVDYKALRGDPSDNIPGVRGVGEKTATTLLLDFGNLDGIYQNLDSEKVKPRIKNLLTEHKEDAYLSRDLAAIKCDIDLEFDLDKLKFGNYNQDDVVTTLSELEFKSLLHRVNLLSDKAVEVEKSHTEFADKFERNKSLFDYKLIDNDEDFDKFLLELKKQKSFAFDTETTGVNPLTCRLLGISFSWEDKSAYYINFSNNNKKTEETNLFNFEESNSQEENLVNTERLEKLREIFANKDIKKYAHNAKYDIRVLQANNLEFKGLSFDTMIASYLLNSGSRQHGLDALSFTELEHEKITKDDLLGKGRDKITFAELEFEKLGIYSCEDADCTFRLVEVLKQNLEKAGLLKLFLEMEIPLVGVLADMENNGIKVDEKVLEKMSKKLTKKIEELQKKIYEVSDDEFNIKSPLQLKKILFNKLKIPTKGVSKTKTGFSTAADELEKIKDLHPIIPLIQEYRELTKLMSTYIEALPKLINTKTKRVHTSYNQTVTATGRLSSTDPNLQNIPAKTELGKEIRRAFVCEDGYELLALDYSQVELRLAAHMSGDKKMIAAFNQGADIHSATAAAINHIDIKEVDGLMRSRAKAINFGILYGQGAHGLSKSAEISHHEAKDFIQKYFAVYEDVKKYMDKNITTAREKGFVETLYGRKRFLPEINSSVAMVKKSAERMAINTPLQGTSADMIKAVMVEVYNQIISKQDEDNPEIRMLLQVHDELIFEVKKDSAKKYAKKIKEIMEDCLELKVPLLVDVESGKNWGDLKAM